MGDSTCLLAIGKFHHKKGPETLNLYVNMNACTTDFSIGSAFIHVLDFLAHL